MPWNFGNFTRIHSWSADAAAGIDILASRMDEEDDNLQDGINSCLNLDGENSPHTDISMNSHKWTEVADAEARDQFAAAGQCADNEFTWCGASTGSATAYNIGIASGGIPLPAARPAGAVYHFSPHITNEAGATLSVNGGTAFNIYCSGALLKGGELIAGQGAVVMWMGSVWSLISPPDQRLSNDIYRPIGARVQLMDDTALVASSTIITASWDWENWDDAAFWSPSPSDETEILIPTMPDSGNLARFRLEAGLIVTPSTAFDVFYSSYFSIDQGSGYVDVQASRDNLYNTVDGPVTLHPSMVIELATGNKVRTKFFHVNGDALNMGLAGANGGPTTPDLENSSWMSITRIG